MGKIEWGDASAWTAIGLGVLSLAVAVLAYVESRRARKAAVRSADAGDVSAQAAVRSAQVAERALAFSEEQAAATAPPKILWSIVRSGKQAFVLRNHGTEAATGVTMDESRMTAYFQRDLPKDVTIPAGGSHRFSADGSGESPVPGEVWLTWDGAADYVSVPLPR
ncbi:hypothetical protein ACRYCC_26475 [Actinomadura scrupuli]|uniref:hypothetical protein n=1 Tax=Actinomadura scrupuli TaxID=559629 RepID=UPI003D9543F4